jgi:hypothetical protein
MKNAASPLHFLILAVAGCLNRHQQRILDYLREENRVFKQHLGAADGFGSRTISDVVWR